MIAEVIVDIAHSEVDKIFDYGCDETVKIGMRVVVPFARSTATGFVVSLKESSSVPAEKLKRIYRVTEEKIAINAECLSLAQKIAQRYRVPLALALRLFLPAEMRTGKVSETYTNVAFVTDIEPVFSKTARAQAALYSYLCERGEAPTGELRDQFGGALEALVKKGYVAVKKVRKLRDPYKSVNSAFEEKTLTPAQQAAVNGVLATDKTVTLLHGVTGSGKT